MYVNSSPIRTPAHLPEHPVAVLVALVVLLAVAAGGIALVTASNWQSCPTVTVATARC